MTLRTFKTFESGFDCMTPQEANDLIGDGIEFPQKYVWVNRDSLCFLTSDDDDSAWVLIERSEWTSTLRGAMQRLYFDFYVSECVHDWTIPELTHMWREWVEWTRLDMCDAEEMHHRLCARSPQERRFADHLLIEWVEWFMRAWGDAMP